MAPSNARFSGPGQRPTTLRGRNRWTADQRLTLHLLFSRFELTLGQRTTIFNSIFADDLRQCGVPAGLPSTSINAQYAMHLKDTRSANWTSICAEPITAEDKEKRELIVEQIVRAADSLEIFARRTAANPSGARQPLKWTVAPDKQRQGSEKATEDDLLKSRAEDSDVSDIPTSTSTRGKRSATQISKWAFDPSSVTEDTTESDTNFDLTTRQCPRPAKRVKTNPVVVVPATPKKMTETRQSIMRTPGSSTLRNFPSSIMRRKAKATLVYSRPNGDLMVTQPEFEMMKLPLVAPSELEAHPPLAGLLFRYWTNDCFSKLDDRGEFIAGKFANFSTSGLESPPVPTLRDFKYFWHDLGAHMNREPVQSPWISTCNHLLWILRLAVQESTKGVSSGRITILDAHAIDRASVFHAQPFHRELRLKRKPFDNGAFRYQGMREFLIYHKIPKKAVLHTFTVQELLQLTVSKPAVDDLLRLNHLSKGMTALETLRKTLQAQQLQLDTSATTAIAAIVRFFGLRSDGAPEHIMHVVSDVVQGWILAVSYHLPQQWSTMADTFASAMITPSGTSWLKDYERMKMAFLDGVRWSQGDVNARHKAERMRTMLGRARKIGLEDPAKILRDELDAAKLGIMMYDQKQQRLLQGRAGQALLTELDDEDDMLPITPRSIGFDQDEDILYEENDDLV